MVHEIGSGAHAVSMCRAQCRGERLRFSLREKKRHRGDSIPCGQSPMDFESISVAARTQCLAMKERSCATRLFHVHLASRHQAADMETHSMPKASQSIQINAGKATLRNTSTGCLVWWYDSRFGCERFRVQFPQQLFVRYAARLVAPSYFARHAVSGTAMFLRNKSSKSTRRVTATA
jgi:hypothetical protein